MQGYENTIPEIKSEAFKKESILGRFIHGWDYGRFEREISAGVEKIREKANPGLEKFWTSLVVTGYASAGHAGLLCLSRLLTGTDRSNPTKVYCESTPKSPRHPDEGETHVDLAIGSIKERVCTMNGIQFDGESNSGWICFCEMKWLSDISTVVSYDVHRNQLVRLVENALCFQDTSRHFADHIYITLVTPWEFFMLRNGPRSRLYQYKYFEYTTNRSFLIEDLRNCGLRRTSDLHNENKWEYPPAIEEWARDERKLQFRWVTFEDLLVNIPNAEFRKPVLELWDSCATRWTKLSET